MRRSIAFLTGTAAITVSIFFYTLKTQKSNEVLSEKTEISPSPTITPTETPNPTTTPKPTRTPTPTPTRIPVPKFTSQEINSFIERFAGQYNIDPNILRHIAICESGFNPEAVNGPYIGLYQFVTVTWKKYRQEMGEKVDYNLRFNAKEATQTAAYALSKNRAYIWPNCVP
ncbi:transglycosylase SLT domain-containing protein [Candidatus Woesebacteria bacterium]|nr:transglycosylase SLT domain-containing protein [Candidatus Woesebacteria bacterium]